VTRADDLIGRARAERSDTLRRDPSASLRLDKWLWFARFFKTRSLAAAQITAGHVRVNGTRAAKPAQAVRPGDTLTFPQGRAVRVVRIRDLPVRRGPAPEARACYDDLSPPQPPSAAAQGAPQPVPGRVDRKERRAARLSRQGPLD
jgi:ribosome-associated heat shock protein Hsp15